MKNFIKNIFGWAVSISFGVLFVFIAIAIFVLFLLRRLLLGFGIEDSYKEAIEFLSDFVDLLTIYNV